MPQIVNRGGSSNPPSNQGRQKAASAERAALPRPVILLIIAVLVLAIGAGAWYTYNGGWQTQSQKEKQWREEGLPVFLAKKGNPNLLNKVNAERAKQGLPPLQVPQNRKPQMHEQFFKNQGQ